MDKFPLHFHRLTEELPTGKKSEIEEAIASSPYLQQRMTEAIQANQLKHIRLIPPGASERGHYNAREKAIYISADTFLDPILQNRRNRLDVLTSTLGHETGHALNTKESDKTLYFVTAQVIEEMRAAGPSGSVDVTPLFAIHQRAARRDEAMAEIDGWNALASRIQHTNSGNISHKEMLDRAKLTTGCVNRDSRDVPQLARGIVLDQDMHMADTRLPKAGAINVEPVAQCHFDQSARSLGAQGKADYRNYYGASLIEQIGQDTTAWIRPPLIKLDMARLGLDPAQLESTGLNLGGKDLSLVDTSQQHQLITLRHAGEGRRHTPDEIARQPERDIHDIAPVALYPDRDDTQREPAPYRAASPAFSDLDHPQHALYSKLKAHLPDYTSETRLSQFTAECHLAGITPRSLASIHIEGLQATFTAHQGWPRVDVDMNMTPSIQDSLHRTEAHHRDMQERASSMQAGQREQAPVMVR